MILTKNQVDIFKKISSLTNSFATQHWEIICINMTPMTQVRVIIKTWSGKSIAVNIKNLNHNWTTREACGKFICVWELAIDYRKYIYFQLIKHENIVGLYILHVSSVSIYTHAHTHTIERSESFLVQQKTSKCL